MSDIGRINGWTCGTCGEHTYAVHVNEGVTPFMLGCRAEGLEPKKANCKGLARSMMYPSKPPPSHVKTAVKWEWYTPDNVEYQLLNRDVREHVDKRGLLIRQLTDAGRALLT